MSGNNAGIVIENLPVESITPKFCTISNCLLVVSFALKIFTCPSYGISYGSLRPRAYTTLPLISNESLIKQQSSINITNLVSPSL